MNIKQIRYAHFMDALNERFGGKLSDMAKATGTGANMLSQIKNKTRGIGDKSAAKMEAALGLDPGAWDEPYTGESNYSPAALKEREFLRLYRESTPAERDLYLGMMRGARNAASSLEDEDS